MHISTVDISIRTLNSAGAPASAPKLYGVVRNSRGEQVQVLTFDDVSETAVGVYTLDDFDVSDPVKFPGTEFTVFWCTKSDVISPETALQRYVIYAEHPSGVVTRLLTWCPSYRPEKLYGYRIERKLPADEAYSTFANTVYPYYFDRSVYATAADFHAARFRIYELVWSSPLDTEPVLGSQVQLVNHIESRHTYCEVYGEIIDVTGGSSTQTVDFFVHEIDTPQTTGTAFFQRRAAVSAPVNYRGEFSIPLICGALVSVDLPEAGLRRRFVVPNKPHALLSDIPYYPIETSFA